MKNQLPFLVLVLLLTPCVCCAQESLPNNSLNFRDVTVATINQTVVEIADNEKTIDFADYDNDGDLDVVISTCQGDFGQRTNKLYRNDNGVFNEVSGAPVIPEFEIDDMARNCIFEDFDNDGFADIVVVCDANSGSSGNSSPGRTKYLRNVDGLFFVNETERLDDVRGASGDGVAADFDNNGLLDIAFANHPNLSQDQLILNGVAGLNPGEFEEVTNANVPVDTFYGSQIRSADMNGDGLIDLVVGNQFNPDAIYFNNNNGGGSGPGDFRYNSAGSAVFFDFPYSTITPDQLLLPADFNNDGLLDLFHTNFGPTTSGNLPRSDGIWKNIGINSNNVPEFESIQEINDDFIAETSRAAAADLDKDGRLDLVVLSGTRRPYIFRNTSENGDISFVAWTPPILNDEHCGFGIGLKNLVGDERTDLLLGASNDDFLFETTLSDSFDAEEVVNGQLPPLLDQEPIRITGEAGAAGVTFDAGTLPSLSRVSILLRSFGDMRLKTLATNDIVMESDRPGHATDEYLQFLHTSGTLQIEVIMDSPSFDGNGDGAVNLLDVAPFIDCLTGASNDCDAFDTDDDGQVTLLDVSKFLDRLSGPPQQEAYSLEILIRSD